ncbi:MAG: imidazolonepropionase [Ignavibacteriae bacterium]|nr:imidazolonepropionase [Ignavibacteriota bacterium]
MNLALINIKQLVAVSTDGNRIKAKEDMRELGIIENAAVLIENGVITWVGRMEELSMGSLKDTEVLDCLDNVVMPGFVDSHTHLLFAGSREDEFALRSQGVTYREIAARGGGILNTVKHVRQATKKELKKNARQWLSAMLQQGTTTVEIKSGYGLDTQSEIKMLEAINELNKEEVMAVVPTFLGAHAVPPEFKDQKADYVETITNTMIPYVSSKKLALFCDVFCEQGYFDVEDSRVILTQAKQFGLHVKLHAEEFSSSGGAELAASLGAVSADHLEHITEKGIQALLKAGVVATLLPGVSFFLNHQYAPARKLIDAGVTVAIATDFNPGSCMSYSMPLMMTIACTHMGMTPEEVITASTLNAAAALNLSHELGSITVGKKADMIVLDIPNYTYLPYHFGENHVVKVVKDGVVLEC